MKKRVLKYRLFQIDESNKTHLILKSSNGNSHSGHNLYEYEEFDTQQEAIDFLMGESFHRRPDNIVILPVVKVVYES